MKGILVLGTCTLLAAMVDAQTATVRIGGKAARGHQASSRSTTSAGGTCLQLSSFVPPESNPGGVGCDGDRIWLGAFWGPMQLWQIDSRTGVVLKTIPAPDTHLGGVTWDGGAVWCCPEQTGQLYRLDPDTGAVLHVVPAPSFGSPDPNPAGLAWDGTALWHADYDRKMIYRLSPVDGSILHFFPFLGSGECAGLAWRDGRLIVSTNDTNEVYELEPVTGAVLDQCFSAGDHLWGVGIDASGGEWVASGDSDEILHLASVSHAGAYCFGDPGSGTPCPCNNDNDGSVPGSGCSNGYYWSGAQLSSFGEARVSADTLVLVATHLEPNNSGLYFQADNDLSPGVTWGDGLRCAGGSLKRLQVRFSDTFGTSFTTVDIAARAGNVLAGDTKHYQCWYRTTLAPPCGPGVNDFNASNGVAVTWTP